MGLLAPAAPTGGVLYPARPGDGSVALLHRHSPPPPPPVKVSSGSSHFSSFLDAMALRVSLWGGQPVFGQCPKQSLGSPSKRWPPEPGLSPQPALTWVVSQVGWGPLA